MSDGREQFLHHSLFLEVYPLKWLVLCSGFRVEGNDWLFSFLFFSFLLQFLFPAILGFPLRSGGPWAGDFVKATVWRGTCGLAVFPLHHRLLLFVWRSSETFLYRETSVQRRRIKIRKKRVRERVIYDRTIMSVSCVTSLIHRCVSLITVFLSGHLRDHLPVYLLASLHSHSPVFLLQCDVLIVAHCYPALCDGIPSNLLIHLFSCTLLIIFVISL